MYNIGMKIHEALCSTGALAEYLGVDWKKEYAVFLEFKNKYSLSKVITDNFLQDILDIIVLIAILLPFLVKKAFSWLFPCVRQSRCRRSESIVEYNYTIKQNPNKLSLLEELNFLKFFFTPA